MTTNKQITNRINGGLFPGLHPGYTGTIQIMRKSISSFLLLLILTLELVGNPAQAEEPANQAQPPLTLEPSPCENIDGEGPRMVMIKAGTFQMGSPAGEAGRSSDEGPRHPVAVVRPFALSRCEISLGQFRRFIEETGYLTDAERSTGCFAWNDKDLKTLRKENNWHDPGFEQSEDHPVVCVSWNDANAYAEWLSARTGETYRLPSEAEWEYAARGRSQQSHFWGDDPDEVCAYANGADHSAKQRFKGWPVSDCDDGAVFTAHTGYYRRNAFGLSDMLGNVWEWTADCWNESYRDTPNDGSTWDADDCSHRVLRGGSWDSWPRDLRSADRDWFSPIVRDSSIGFRLARTL